MWLIVMTFGFSQEFGFRELNFWNYGEQVLGLWFGLKVRIGYRALGQVV